jgi:predicted transcriptional regulator
VQRRLTGDGVSALRAAMKLSEMEFALLLGVTVRAVELWEADVVMPSLLMSMVIREQAARHAARSRPEQHRSLGRRGSRASRPARAAGKRSKVVPTGEATRDR